ncbi:hypothetical protein CEXT_111041 [Caerostris extrusa]|uniref:Uncharacterized protein n=1 Tax=Caerostris extrusa TaxID=172846 RepID=A0AAV4MVG6_CAEEX|nr:hypothetical protein CEXT_111041 [Caerostris extrusa]
MRTAQFPRRTGQGRQGPEEGHYRHPNLPTEASNEYIYGQRRLGCCGIPIAAEESDINLVDTAWLLTSRDDICALEAFSSLVSTVQKDLDDSQTMPPLVPFCLARLRANLAHLIATPIPGNSFRVDLAFVGPLKILRHLYLL